MRNTAQASIKISRSRRRSRRRGVYLPQKMAQSATMENPQLASRPWLADIDSAATPNERALLFWLDAAARFHTDPVRDVMVAIKTVEYPAAQPGKAAHLYVWEVAWYREQDAIKWHFIVWDVSGYGVRFHPCVSREEAMALFAQPVAGVLASVRNSTGVYLRPDGQET
jgi:hypothetical protein